MHIKAILTRQSAHQAEWALVSNECRHSVTLTEAVPVLATMGNKTHRNSPSYLLSHFANVKNNPYAEFRIRVNAPLRITGKNLNFKQCFKVHLLMRFWSATLQVFALCTTPPLWHSNAFSRTDLRLIYTADFRGRFCISLAHSYEQNVSLF